MRLVLASALAVLSALGNSALGEEDKTPAVATAVVAVAHAPTCPTAAGVYYRREAGWKLIEEIHSSGFHTTGVAKATLSYGAAAAKVKAVFREVHSPYQVTDPATKFCIVGVTQSGRDISIVQMREEKGRREMEIASMRMWTGVSAEFKDNQLLKIQVEKLDDKTFLITPSTPIKPGEYILFTNVPDTRGILKANGQQALGGYDFGLHAE